MVTETLHAHALSDDFANRIGRLIETRGHVVDALFDPANLPDLLSELTVSDEARKAGLKVHVMQRPAAVWCAALPHRRCHRCRRARPC